MSFVQNARREVSRRPANDPLRITLEYLLENSIGFDKATPTDLIIQHLNTKGHSMSREKFQQSILAETRQTLNEVCIASSSRGLYLMDSAEDASHFDEYYGNRTRAHQTIFEKFRENCSNFWPDDGS